MATEECDGCGAAVPIAGGIANLWNTNPQSSGGMTLEFEDGSEHFLCYACIERLPDYPTREDVAELDAERDRDGGGDGAVDCKAQRGDR